MQYTTRNMQYPFHIPYPLYTPHSISTSNTLYLHLYTHYSTLTSSIPYPHTTPHPFHLTRSTSPVPPHSFHPSYSLHLSPHFYTFTSSHTLTLLHTPHSYTPSYIHTPNPYTSILSYLYTLLSLLSYLTPISLHSLLNFHTISIPFLLFFLSILTHFLLP
jgi:hypothetical protein